MSKVRQRPMAICNPYARKRVVKKTEDFSKRVELHKPKVPPIENRLNFDSTDLDS